jgi:4a-hydroxytetrahydrobiopterin dehydratase
MDLADRTWPSPGGETSVLTGAAITGFASGTPDWTVVDEHHIERAFSFPDFQSALDLVVRIGAAAEAMGHHPDIELSWGRVGVRLHTHDIGGLSEADFILAARIDRLVG